jgi:uncharacterized protein (DUF697 family)
MAAEQLTKTWRRIRDAVLNPERHSTLDAEIAERARQQAPIVWLLGKVQSGKTSIIHAITGHPDAEIGRGYKPCTRSARVFDFPDDAPVIRFLDTCGLGEVGYEPDDDLAQLENRAHVVLAVARAMDPQQEEVLAVLRAVRKRHPDWPVVLAQTSLHDGYPDGADHPRYRDLRKTPALDDLHRSLTGQATVFQALPGGGPVYPVPVDLTRPEEGYSDPQYGLEALLDALEAAGSAGMQTILHNLRAGGMDVRAERARPHILGYALAAGTTDTIPLAGFVTVPTIQGKMLHSLGRIYDLRWERQTIREFAASLGTGTVLGIGLSLGARQLAKLVPVYGQTVGAAAAGATSFAVTYALGRAACFYLRSVRRGRSHTEGVAQIYHESLREAFDIVRARRPSSRSVQRREGGTHG